MATFCRKYCHNFLCEIINKVKLSALNIEKLSQYERIGVLLYNNSNNNTHILRKYIMNFISLRYSKIFINICPERICHARML